MKKMTACLMLISTMVFASGANADGTSCSNFSGNYKVTSTTETVNGQTVPQGASSNALIVIDQSACQSLDLINNDPSNPFDDQVVMDGQPHQDIQNGQAVTFVGRFEGSSAIIDMSSPATASSPAMSIAMTLALSQDGKVLTVTLSPGNGFEIVSTAVRQ